MRTHSDTEESAYNAGIEVMKMAVSNVVVSVQLQQKLCLRKIAISDANLFHEFELLLAALIRKWHPMHIAAFHNGKVIVLA